MGLTIVSSLLLARLLSVDDRGEFQLFITAISYVVTIACGGVGFALTLAMRQRQYMGWRYYFLAFLAFSIPASLVATAIFNITPFVFLFVCNVFFTAIFTITLEKSKIDPQLRFYRLIQLQQPLFLVLIYGVSYLFWRETTLNNALGLLTLFSLIQGWACVYFLFRIEKSFKEANKKQLQSIDKKTFLTTWIKQNLYQTFGATTASMDKFLIVSLLGNYALGLYTVCMTFDALLTRFINMLADYYYSGLLNQINRLKSVLAIMAIMSLGAIIFVPLFAETVIRVFFSEKYTEVAPMLVWFMLNSIIAGLSWLLSQNMLLQGKQVLLFTRQLISLSVFIGLFILFKAENLGLYGVAYALLGASSVRLLISIFYYFKYPLPASNVENKVAPE